ncbi:hypothetical protein ONR57_12235 [Hoyosella sp. YIM 151337]|uniref:hypothetical protein n=1 Tax=Hoyosella sp. YIM 151337 TaxID=2992742 RepID=UPI002235E575|nr:hypothetical protein [Hoyosella sp. YIM 151337]MCW4354069.1 hypothetical protein [Hoyosella sp. YIM 151337]
MLAAIPIGRAVDGFHAAAVLRCGSILREHRHPRGPHTTRNPGPGVGLLDADHPGMRPAVFSSLIVVTSMDLTAAYLPVLGEQHGFSALTVTTIITARALTAIVSRLFLAQLLAVVPRKWLLNSGSLYSALPVAIIPILP